MKIGIIVALDKELEQLRRVFDGSDVLVQKCGIGKVNAAIGAAEMIRSWKPDAIISSGCAGGNGDDLQVQDVVVGTEVCYHDVYCGTAIDYTTVYGQVQGMPARYKADPYLLSKAQQLFLSSPLPQGGLRGGSPAQSLEAILRYLDQNRLDTLHASTQIIIVPGYSYKYVRALVTNFHQPRSTLLLLVSALVGDDWRTIYRYALDHQFRFLSYGDSSLLIPKPALLS